jgi:hypothetical protein
MSLEVQVHVQNCENYLMNPDSIEPNELAQYINSFSYLGANDYITSLV